MVNQRQSVEDIFCTALDLPAGERSAYLDRVCRDTPELRPLVETLLAEEERAGSFLKAPLLAYSAEAKARAERDRSPVPEPRPAIAAAGWKLPHFQVGQLIGGRFAVVRFLARGGMGEVYEVEDRLLQGEHVALKIIRPEIAEEAGSTLRFEQEVLLARKVHHPNLCPIYEIFRSEEPGPAFLFLTMKLLHGETLDACLLRRRTMGEREQLTRQERLDVSTRLMAAVAAIHAAGIIHRDIKPKNVMLERAGSRLGVYLLDFGLARLHQAEATVLKTGMVAGTVGYLAPELLQGQRPTRATDLFALGIVLHQVLTEDLPIEALDGLGMVPSERLAAADAPLHLIEAVREMLADDPERRCRAFKAARSINRAQGPAGRSPALQLLPVPQPSPSQERAEAPRRGFWTRRTFLAASAASACTLGGGAVAWQHEWLYKLLHPLPQKRFVALAHWPPQADARVRPMILHLIDAIGTELARAEAFDRNLYVTAQSAATELLSPEQLNQMRESLGANLVLAASGSMEADGVRVWLHVMDPATGRTLRAKELHSAGDEQFTLPARALRAAAELLDVRQYVPDELRVHAGTVHPEALAAFQAAEALMKQDNDAGLQPAIVKYREAIDLDPRYAIAYAKLAQAYGRTYAISRDTGALHLARANCDHALSLDAKLVEARLLNADLLEKTGDQKEALEELKRTLALDTSNPGTLLWFARLYTRMNRWQDAERVFHQALQVRPNYWLIYNELGFALDAQGRLKEAIEAFRTAAIAAPGSAMAACNLGVEYMQLGDFADAMECLKRSLKLQPDYDGAAVNLSLCWRYQGRYDEALVFAQRAVAFNPNISTNWLELADCYSSIPDRDAEAKIAYLRASKEAEKCLQENPNDGPEWILLALYRLRSGSRESVDACLTRANSLIIDDIDSQLSKVRVLEGLGHRDQALTLLKRCFERGVRELQIKAIPDLRALRQDERYLDILKSHRATEIKDE